MSDKRRILFLCTGNSCRSQMAEAIVNTRMGDAWQAVSAGTEPSGYVHPLAIKALAEIVGSDPKTLMKHYQHVTTELRRRTVELLPFWQPEAGKD